ncbi:uncharacterized protein MYCFIDRAFT_180658 [Pseudocercospora fijiensis CIRAD86]|uniref:Uncharacterized protein n=1 Tax=Pseudocercospora fijiensis (strain CIRAD86) TaxID=383855 RepID=M3AH64_PSEFD|nr:uncharacterized protein MYCFIDRAFT_180658 [Pseudocercospora fijiensis CIRAD86]EME76837.1 hypothetical protein MYCFIDRAFT_180658 [Pseudocercospora fijiensis CIRAD86]
MSDNLTHMSSTKNIRPSIITAKQDAKSTKHTSLPCFNGLLLTIITRYLTGIGSQFENLAPNSKYLQSLEILESSQTSIVEAKLKVEPGKFSSLKQYEGESKDNNQKVDLGCLLSDAPWVPENCRAEISVKEFVAQDAYSGRRNGLGKQRTSSTLAGFAAFFRYRDAERHKVYLAALQDWCYNKFYGKQSISPYDFGRLGLADEILDLDIDEIRTLAKAPTMQTLNGNLLVRWVCTVFTDHLFTHSILPFYDQTCPRHSFCKCCRVSITLHGLNQMAKTIPEVFNGQAPFRSSYDYGGRAARQSKSRRTKVMFPTHREQNSLLVDGPKAGGKISGSGICFSPAAPKMMISSLSHASPRCLEELVANSLRCLTFLQPQYSPLVTCETPASGSSSPPPNFLAILFCLPRICHSAAEVVAVKQHVLEGGSSADREREAKAKPTRPVPQKRSSMRSNYTKTHGEPPKRTRIYLKPHPIPSKSAVQCLLEARRAKDLAKKPNWTFFFRNTKLIWIYSSLIR